MKQKPTKNLEDSLLLPFTIVCALRIFVLLKDSGTPFIVLLITCMGGGFLLALLIIVTMEILYRRFISAENTAKAVLSGDEAAKELKNDAAGAALKIGKLIFVSVSAIIFYLMVPGFWVADIIFSFIMDLLYDFLFIRPKKKLANNSQDSMVKKVLAVRFEAPVWSPEKGVDVERIRKLGLIPNWNDTVTDKLLTEKRNGSTYEISALKASCHYKEFQVDEDMDEYVDAYDTLFEGCVIHKICKKPSVTVPMIIVPKSLSDVISLPENAQLLPEQDPAYEIFGIGSIPDIYEVKPQLRILNELSHLTETPVMACIFHDGSYYLAKGRRFLDIDSDEFSHVEMAMRTRDDLELVDAGIKMIG